MTDSPTTVIHPSKSQITIFDFGQSVREHFSVTAFPTIKAFELLHEDELLEPPPPLRASSVDELSDDLGVWMATGADFDGFSDVNNLKAGAVAVALSVAMAMGLKGVGPNKDSASTV